MDDQEYKRLCAQPDVMRRDQIRATAALLREPHPGLAMRVSGLLGAAALPKPQEHSGGAESDFFYIDLDVADLDAIVSALGDLEAQLAESGAPTDQLGWVARLLDRWNDADSSRPAV